MVNLFVRVTMKRILMTAVLAWACLSVGAHGAEWLTDLAKAKELAKAEKKTVLVNFTGSDWCGYCIKLKKEVFDTEEFAKFAKDKLVLVEIDFPRKKAQSEEVKKANRELQKQYKVEGFPTLVFLNGEGKKLGEEVGYGGGGPKAFLAKVEPYVGK